MGSSSNAPTPLSSSPTLSSQSSSDESESGYFDIETFYGDELLDAYRPEGLHPVHFGDLFHHGRLMMVRKLGHGAFSTVWLAKDTLYNEPSRSIINFTDFPPSKLSYKYEIFATEILIMWL